MDIIVKTGTTGLVVAQRLGLRIVSMGDWLTPGEVACDNRDDALAFEELVVGEWAAVNRTAGCAARQSAANTEEASNG